MAYYVNRDSLLQYLRKTSKSTLHLWVVLLALALLCAQGVKLHVHALDHDHHQHDHHTHKNELLASDHSHVSIAHLSLDNSHSDHHDKVIYESDACPDCLLTKVSSKLPLAALLAVLFTLLLMGVCRLAFVQRRDIFVFFSRRCHFTPPLRAPPVV